MTEFGLSRPVSSLREKQALALVLGQGAMWGRLWELVWCTPYLAYSREMVADEVFLPAGPQWPTVALSAFCRKTADGPKRKPLPWRKRWHWPRSSCEPGGRSRKSAVPWAVSGKL